MSWSPALGQASDTSHCDQQTLRFRKNTPRCVVPRSGSATTHYSCAPPQRAASRHCSFRDKSWCPSLPEARDCRLLQFLRAHHRRRDRRRGQLRSGDRQTGRQCRNRTGSCRDQRSRGTHRDTAALLPPPSARQDRQHNRAKEHQCPGSRARLPPNHCQECPMTWCHGHPLRLLRLLPSHHWLPSARAQDDRKPQAQGRPQGCAGHSPFPPQIGKSETGNRRARPVGPGEGLEHISHTGIA